MFFCLFISSIGIAQNKEFKQFTYPNGTVSSEGYLENGKPNGYWKSFNTNGMIMSEGNRVNFLLEGVWKFYDEQGKMKEEISYKEGKKHGRYRKYEQGILLSECFYDLERLDSISRWFYPTGQVKKSIPFVDDFEHGKGFDYDVDGTILGMQTYRSGVMVKNLKMNRTDSEGRKQGLHMEFYENGMTKWEGNYFNDLKDGYFKYYDKEGSLIKNERWIMGVLQQDDELAGRMRLKQIYNEEEGYVERVGAFRNGEMDGSHRVFDKNGNLVRNEIYSLGKLIASGTLDSLGRREGEWLTFYEKGELKSKGSYLADKKTGPWFFYYRDSTIEQTGSYEEDRPEGMWKWYFQGQILQKEERYRNGLLSGNSIEYDSLGNVLAKGAYFEGQRDGRWTHELRDHKEVGRYKDGLMTGEWKYFYDDGTLQFVGSFIDGIPHATHVYYYPSGKVRVEGDYVYGKKEGSWRYYDKNGLLIVTVYYENGKEIKYNGSKIEVDLVE